MGNLMMRNPATFPSMGYGILYNRYTTVNITSSDTWRVPNYTDWTTLETYLGTNPGLKLKANRYEGQSSHPRWSHDGSDFIANNHTDDYGFSAIPSGTRRGGGEFNSSFSEYIYNVCAFHISELDVPYSFSLSSYSYWGNILVETYHSTSSMANRYGCSIRLVRDAFNDEINFRSEGLAGINTGSYTGNDGKKYDDVRIGNQVWLTKNLLETKYRNGTTIPILRNPTDWSNDTTGGMCYWDNDICFY